MSPAGTFIRRAMQLAVIAGLALVCVLPWGLKADQRFFLPLVPFIAVYQLADQDGEIGWAWTAFATGLAMDVLTYGPLGFWSLIYVVGWLLAAKADIAKQEVSMLARWPVLAAIAVAQCMLAWSLSSIFTATLAEWRPFAFAAAATTLSYPAVAAVCGILVPGRPVSVRPAAERGA